MKYIFLVFAFLIAVSCNNSKNNLKIVEVSCGQCQFGLSPQRGCDLAVRIEGKAYFVDGAHIDDFGDAHEADTGFCEVIRTAEVTGEDVNNKFKATSVTLPDK